VYTPLTKGYSIMDRSCDRPDRETAMAENSNHKRHVLLITGAPGIGKTTVMRRAAEGLKHKGLRGFYTEEIPKMGNVRLSPGELRRDDADHRTCGCSEAPPYRRCGDARRSGRGGGAGAIARN
jgi:hypothetical protein